jgi:hypothetical protein
VTSAIVRNTAISSAREEEHLVLKGVSVQAVGVVEDDGLPLPPILEVKLGAVFCGDGVHGTTDNEAGALPNSQSPVVAVKGGDEYHMDTGPHSNRPLPKRIKRREIERTGPFMEQIGKSRN